MIFRLSDNCVYRKVKDQVLLIELKTGLLYYFSGSTHDFFNALKTPTSVDYFVKALDLSENEGTYLLNFFSFLNEKNILETAASSDADPADLKPYSYIRPLFIRQGEKNLDEIAVNLTTCAGCNF